MVFVLYVAFLLPLNELHLLLPQQGFMREFVHFVDHITRFARSIRRITNYDRRFTVLTKNIMSSE